MNTSWEETQARLVSIQEKYNSICREWKVTSNRQRKQQLRALASACLAEIQATIQEYGEEEECAVGE